MDNLSLALNNYVMDPENSETNYALAVQYWNLEQTAAAVSYYLRAAEFAGENKDLAYECLIRVAQCFEKQGNRGVSVRSSYKHAICLHPTRPEAYFLLSRFNERVQNYVDSYTLAVIAEKVSRKDHPPLRSDVEYPGDYAFLYEKAVSSWWWGRFKESREMFQELANEWYDQLNDMYLHSVQDNLSRLGSGSKVEAFNSYDESMYSRLKYKFDGSEAIKKNFSQAYQDMFVLSATKGKRGGTYLEIGSGDPFVGNNTALLEKLYGWRGIGVEMDEKFMPDYRNNRSNPVLCENAMQVKYTKILRELAPNKVIDYLQVDCEPSKSTFEVLLELPLHLYKFAVITYEHDHYVDISKSYRFKSRAYLKSMGYVLVVNDVSVDGKSTFEDWWVHPDLVDAETIKLLSSDIDKITNVGEHFLEDAS